MSTTAFPEIKQAIDQTAAAFDEFRKTNVQRVDELRERVEELESRQKQPGRTGEQKDRKPAFDHWLTADGEPLPIMRKGMDFGALYAPKTKDDEALSLAEFVRGIAGMKTTDGARKALSVGTAASGGYTVPSVLLPGILTALVPASAMLNVGAGVIDVSESAGKTFDLAAINAIPTAGWRAEAGAVAESEPTFRLVATQPRSLSFFFKVSRELLADAMNVEVALRTAIAQAFAKELDRTGLRGTGTAPEPRGLLNTTNVNVVANGANGASLATTTKYGNLFSAVQAILEDDAPMPTAAIMAPRSQVTLGSLADTTGQPVEVPPMLRTMSMVATSQIPVNLTVGTSTDCSEIYIGDFTKVAFVMRERPTIQLAGEMFATTGQVAFICHVRADVAVLYPQAFAVVTGVRA